jgi:uncharacterized membrane protein YdjX (TVP38/TMEM64 family)
MIRFCEARGERYLALLVLVTRLLPVLSFDIVSYAAGMSGLRFSYYVPATLIGMAPSTFLLTYLGSMMVIGGTMAVVLSCIAAALIVVLPFGVKRWNWFGLAGVIRIE